MTDIFLGRLVKAFGIRGELKLHPSDDFWGDVLSSSRLIMRSEGEGGLTERRLVIERGRPHGRNYVLKIEGVDDRNAAEALVGAELFISEQDIDVALPDRLLPYQVVGMRVRTEDGEDVGEVSSVRYSSAHDIYEVTGKQGTFMVPVVPEFIVAIDRDERVLTFRPLPGLMQD